VEGQEPASLVEPESGFPVPSECRLRGEAAVDYGTSLLGHSWASLSRWGTVESGTFDVEVVQEGEGGFVSAFDEELGGVEAER
jgi:hypothetical protein